MSNRFEIFDTGLSGLQILQCNSVIDCRGSLTRLFCGVEFTSAGWNKPVAQINHTYTAKRGTVRGMHFQKKPSAEMKFVSCIKGKVWDVAVDLRLGSQTLLQWHAEELSADNRRGLLIPEGFAHGFQCMTDDVELLYCHSAAYDAEAESGLNPKDPALAINWPLEIIELSARDTQHPILGREFLGVEI